MAKEKKETVAKVEDMSVADVLKLPLFYSNATKVLNDIWSDRETARKKAAKKGERLKAHPIDALHNAGILEPGTFIVEYAKVLDKVAAGLPRSQRDVISTLGGTAFNNTVKQLLENEKKGNKRNRNNK